MLYSKSRNAGVQIQYPSISLHAQQGSSVYMQLCLSDQLNTADEDLETVELFVKPTTVSHGLESSEGAADEPATEAAPVTNGAKPPVEELFLAISACADLHPDPEEDGEGGGEPMPGTGGWITSDNMHEYMDSNGNFSLANNITVIGGEEEEQAEERGMDGAGENGGTLGAGAGRVRTAAEFEDAEDGAQDDTKWARTG